MYKSHEQISKTLIHGYDVNVAKFVMKARFDGNSELVAELVSVNGFKTAYAIKDGAEGPRGWVVYAILATLFLF